MVVCWNISRRLLLEQITEEFVSYLAIQLIHQLITNARDMKDMSV